MKPAHLCVLVAALVIGGCVSNQQTSGTRSADNPQLQAAYTAYLDCLLTIDDSTLSGLTVTTVPDVVDARQGACVDSRDGYVETLGRLTMRANRWTSLQPQVWRRFREEATESTSEFLAAILILRAEA